MCKSNKDPQKLHHMTLVGVPRVVPSGKIYRQIFDDEINLVQTLAEARSKITQHKVLQLPGRIPLVRDLDRGTNHGFLSSRQQMWAEGMPNDEVTENPVQYKEAVRLLRQKAQESETLIAAREVRGLADVIISEKKNSNILERISDSKKVRFEEVVATLRKELAVIGKEMELCFVKPGKLFLTMLSESDQAFESLFHATESNITMATYSIQDFEKMWGHLFQEAQKRRQWIIELGETLRQAEVDRVERITIVLSKYTKILEDIAYLLSSDVHRFIHNETMMINQALLGNRRAIAKLILNLMEADLQRDSFYRYQMEERKEIWKVAQKEYIISSFRKFMENERIQNPSAVRMELENMLEEQLLLAEKRKTHLFSLSHLLPLTHTKGEISEWYESLVALNKRIDTYNVQFMMRIRLQYEKVCQECLAKVQECKQNLIDTNICTQEEAENIANLSFYQLVGTLQSRFEQEIEKMDLDLEQLVKNTEINCRHLYQYFHDALILWDVHQQKLTQEGNHLHKTLNDCRCKHEHMNKLREMNLDISIDKLRTQSSDERLKAQLDKVYALLDLIRAGYTAFHHDLLSKVTSYPSRVFRELRYYSSSISRYFYVKGSYKGKPLRKHGVSAEEEEMAKEAEEMEEEEETLLGLLEPKSGEGIQQGQNVGSSTENTEAEVSELEEEREEPESSLPKNSQDRSGDVLRPEEGGTSAPEPGGVNGGPASTKPPRVSSELGDMLTEFFTTSNGNTYKVVEPLKKSRLKRSEKYYAGKLKASSLPSYVQQVYLSEGFLRDVKREIRQQFFEHLEKWFDQTVTSTWAIMRAKKEELNSEVQLRIHLHEPRQERIEKDIYNVRMAELQLHYKRLMRHCHGMLEALNKEKVAFVKLREDHNGVSKSFRVRIQEMENLFQTESSAEKVMSLCQNLHSELINHMEVLQVSLRSYRQYLEEALGKLRDSNTEFLKACRLFANGGNFAPEELDLFMKRLQKENGRIDYVEGLIMIDMEKMEANYMDEATEILGKFENKFRLLSMDKLFIDKIQRFLTNIQVKIKSEVARSNRQTQTLNSYLNKLVERIDACVHPNVDKESISPERLYDFAKFIMEELRKRCKYLNCELLPLEPEIPDNQPDVSNQESATTTISADISSQESKVIVMGMERIPILNPSKMGKPAFDDVAFSVIRHLIGHVRGRKMVDSQYGKDAAPQPAGGEGPSQAPFSLAGGVRHESVGGLTAVPPPVKKSTSVAKQGSGSGSSIQKYTRLTKTDKKILIFGDKPKDADFECFTGIIFTILWDNFDIMMNVAEEFYKKDKHQITRPDCLQETYDQCIDVLGQKMLTYLLQSDEYHIACISEFRIQLKNFEEQVPNVIRLFIRKLLKDHEQLLADSTEQIRRNLQDQLQKWDAIKERNMGKLQTSLGHPDNIPVLDALSQEEEKRQEKQSEGILLCTNRLEVCVMGCAQKFVSVLATCTETILLELDKSLTVDDVQLGKMEKAREKTMTLYRRKKAGLSLDAVEQKLVDERGSRTWPGIPQTTIASLPNKIIHQETSSVTTAKTTLGHVAAIEERDAVYVKFKETLNTEFARIKEESTAHLLKTQHWADWWKKSVQKIKQLYL